MREVDTAMTAQVNENEKIGRKIIDNLFTQIKNTSYPTLEWGFTKGQFDFYDGYTNKTIFDVKYRNIYNKWGEVWNYIYLSAHKVDEMMDYCKKTGKKPLYLMIDNTNDNIWMCDLSNCYKWRKGYEWMQKNNYTHEKDYILVYHIPRNSFKVIEKTEYGYAS